ncbi:hypothetical protein L798_12972 [Zootermopsis nevadensis]|uniref:Uncharacterized protein n=2 Tax=Zootermopsis nevadensis TaxID=136037 RepID=A0A067QP60_ZOONE|nr:hypothetical protein L798_12972 [Zootermopsis nevadensis]
MVLNKILQNIVRFPISLSPDAEDLVRKLLQTNPSQRLGKQYTRDHQFLI